MAVLALAVLLSALDAPRVDPAPPWLAAPAVRYGVPAGEVLAYELGVFAYDHWVVKEDYAAISPATIRDNFVNGPRLDNDHIFVNFLGHPYQGSIPHNFARSSGLGFWTASLYCLLGDLAWEWLAEVQAPSTNDVIESGPASSLWGEALYRTGRLLLAHHEGPAALHLLRALGALAADPAGTVNRALLGPPAGAEDDAGLPFRARLYAGALRWQGPAGRTQALLGGELLYGLPREPGSAWVTPFDYFEVHASAAFVGVTSGEGELLGILAGRGYGAAGPAGCWGLFGMTDFGTGQDFRWSSTAAGPGAVAAWRWPGVTLRATAIGAGVLMGASGTTAQTDYVEPNDTVPGISRYAMGPGVLALAEVELTVDERITLRAAGRSTWIAALVPAPGWERVDQLTLGLGALLPGKLLLGADLTWADRLPARDSEPAQSGWAVRAFAGVQLGQ